MQCPCRIAAVLGADCEVLMYARVSTIKVGVQGMDASIRQFKDVILPQMRMIPGFEGATMLASREKEMTRTTTYWNSRETLDSSAEALNRLRASFVDKAVNAEVISVETFEVVVDEGREAG